MSENIEMNLDVAMYINNISHTCNSANSSWWKDINTGERIKRNKGELLMLIVSEISECLEGIRKDLMDDKIPYRKMEEVELADALIRIFDYCGGFGLDIGGALVDKMIYNRSRHDHTVSARIASGGKKF